MYRRFLFLTVLSLFLLLGCSQQEASTLRVLAGSELKDLRPHLDAIRKATGIQLEFDYIGTLDGADKLVHDSSYDLAWFSHGKYIVLTQDKVKTQPILAQEKIMLSPVVLGIKQSTAKSIGWDSSSDVTWKQIAEEAKRGTFKFMMTDATASNSGFSALFGLLAAFSPNPSAPDFNKVNQELVGAFFKGNTGRSGSSGWLAERYVAEETRFDGLINYESVLLSLNQNNTLKEPLVLIYPSEGIVTADYPLMLLKDSKRPQYEALVTYLKSEPFQHIVQDNTHRRPVNRKVKLANQFRTNLLELPFPSTLEVIDQALFTFLDQNRPPSTSLFVLDVSGSMAGERLDQLRHAVNNLTGLDQSIAGKFARFREREDITLIPFSTLVKSTDEFVINDVNQSGEDMQQIRNSVNKLEAVGGTAIYEALIKAYDILDKKYGKDTSRYYTIVLMTDGQNNKGRDFEAWRRWYRSAPDHLQRVRVFPILFGNSDVSQMEAVASMTGGRTFDARSKDLAKVFKSIRGYQ